MNNIVIGLVTCGRPKMLRRALDSLKPLVLPKTAKVHLVLVDNNYDGSARPVFDEVELPFAKHYVQQSRRGIPFARNAVLDKAIELKADYLAFFDDDEVVEKDWLKALYDGMVRYKCAAIYGDVEYEFPDGTIPWVREHAIYKVNVGMKTGDALINGATNNICFNMDFMVCNNLRFDERYALSGGTDRFMSEDIFSAGGQIILVKEARTRETIALGRNTWRWVVRRRFRSCCNRVISEKRSRGLRSALRYVLPRLWPHSKKSIYFLTAYAVKRRRSALYRGCDHGAWVLGMLTGIFGGRYNEYRRIYGE